ncbi:DUF6498-containing protein [Halorussus amylolyticus]|uniref:DUF6498-containing protein n=1 Tax=Halorussus amylolyticus TaxID=1126242 RepID=UPI0010532231|nr:DUF6498-containing protein [Halorussus amylolyticus]
MGKSSLAGVVKTAPRVLRESRDFVSGCVLNLALILGVVVFEWSLVEIAFIYIIEIAIINVLFLSVALFTSQSVDALDGDAWDNDPTPLQPIALIPPIYWRNIKFVLRRAIIAAFLIGLIMRPIVSSYDLDSGLPLSVGLAIAGTVFFQLTRVWRYFIANRSYRDKSPADALEFAFVPVVELYLMLVYVAPPITIVLAGIVFGTDTNLTSRAWLLLYLVPMGAIRAWMGSLDPRTDDFEINVN